MIMLINTLTLIIDNSFLDDSAYILFNLILNPLVSTLVMTYFLKKEGVSLMKSILISLAIALTVIVGSRIMFVLGANNYIRNFGINPLRLEARNFTMFGGFILTFPMVLIISKLMKIKLWRMLDLITPGWSLGIAFNKTGCLLNGCCYGIPTKSNFGISYPVGTPPYDNFYNDLIDFVGENGDLSYSLPLYPIQIIESLIGLFGFILSVYLFKKRPREGVVFATFAVIFSFARFILNFFRATPYAIRDTQHLKPFMYLGVFILMLVVFLYRSNRIEIK